MTETVTSFDLVLRSATLTDRVLAVEFMVVANRVPASRFGARVDLDLSWIEAAEGDDVWLQWRTDRHAWDHLARLLELIDMGACLTESKATFEWAAGVLARHRGRLVQLSFPDGKTWTWSEATDPRSLTWAAQWCEREAPAATDEEGARLFGLVRLYERACGAADTPLV